MRIGIFKKFANFENRVERRFDTYEEYITAAGYFNSFGPFDRINFKIGDGVDASVIVNISANTPDFCPDYLIVLDDSSDNILSRWFIVESEQIRGLQYRLTLRRDLIADNWDIVLDSNAIVSRGWTNITRSVNTPIYNSEGFSPSQIKQDEVLLKDKTGSAWVVGFMKNGQNIPASVTWSSIHDAVEQPDILTRVLDNDRGITLVRTLNDAGFGSIYRYGGSGVDVFSKLTYYSGSAYEDTTLPGFYNNVWTWLIDANYRPRFALYASEYLRDNKLNEKAQPYFETSSPYKFTDEIEAYENKYFYGPDSRIFKLKKRTVGRLAVKVRVPSALKEFEKASLMYANEKLPSINMPDNWDNSNDDLVFYAEEVQYSRDYVTDSQEVVDISTNRARLNNRPWSMCAMPLGEVVIKTNQGTFTTKTGIAEAFATKFTEQIGNNCIDVQILPYCPCPEFVNSNGMVDLTKVNEGSSYSYVKSGSTKDSILLWSRENSGSISIDYHVLLPLDPVEFKVGLECSKYRLCAPNYSSTFEFSAELNGGIQGFDVDFTYEPNGSYIRVAPKFHVLYGKNFNDGRGLIISTNLSLPRVDDAWVNYQLNNANYQKTFDRQIKTMEFNRNVGIGQTTAQVANAIWGESLMNGIGAGIDKVGQMISGNRVENYMEPAGFSSNGQFAMTAAVNTAFDVIRQNRAIEDAKYNQEMQIGNIKAQPQTITQIGAFNINNKFFPILEIYDATDDEKENIRKYINNRSMNINRTATIREYLKSEGKTWIEGSLINTFDFVGDAHELSTLKSDIALGCYIIQEKE